MTRHLSVVVLATLLAGACTDMTIPNYNAPSIEELQTNPTPAAVQAAAVGLQIGARSNITDRTGYVSMTGIIGRESLTIDASDPRYVSELLAGPLTNSGAFGGGLWNARYQNIRNANILLGALDRVAGLSSAEKEAVRGFAKTMQALDFLLVINTRDTNGAPIEVGGTIDQLAPIESKARVYAHILKLLDEAAGHLRAGGSTFPFPLSSGYEGFNTPGSYLRFNRALKARVLAYQGSGTSGSQSYRDALTALQESFLDRSRPLALGVYNTYGTGSDAANQLTNISVYAHPSIVADAERQPGGEPDRRVQDKVRRHPQPLTAGGVSSEFQATMYLSPSAPVPIIRNEELILLRAEARWFTGDRAGALDEINFIRVNSGGLAPIAMPATDAAFITELLKQRRYSLFFEGGHRWIDARRFNRLGDLPKDQSSHNVHQAFLIPEAECLARERGPTCAA